MRTRTLPLRPGCRRSARAAGRGEVHAQAGLLTGGADRARADHAVLRPAARRGALRARGRQVLRDQIQADGSAELAITGPEFFRNVWVDEVVINEIEIRPLGIDSLEFDDEGTASISFVTIKPGSFSLHIPGTTSDSQKAVFNVK